MVIGGIIS